MATNTNMSLQSEVNRLKLELNALQVSAGSEQIYIGQYLLERLSQLGVKVGGSRLLIE